MSFNSGISVIQELTYILPEVIMTLGLLLVIILTVVGHRKTTVENNAIMLVSLGTTGLALGALITSPYFSMVQQLGTGYALYGSLSTSFFAVLFRGLILAGLFITILLSHTYLKRYTRVVGDYYALVMGASLGAMVLCSAADLVTLFVGLETLSIPSYILAGYLRKSRITTEASFKYLVYGSVASAMFLFGASMLYGLTGSTMMQDIAHRMLQFSLIKEPLIFITVIMMLATAAFKLSLAPFHMWTPDVYDGAPTPVSAFLSAVSKTAGFALILRLVFSMLGSQPFIPLLLIVLSVVSMTIGNLVALRQNRLKRMLAYSTIAQAGYILLGLVTATYSMIYTGGSSVFPGNITLIYYLIAYVFMNLGAFACVVYFNAQTGSDDIRDIAGLVKKSPFVAFSFTIFLLSLAGMPITSGFFAKFFLFQAIGTQSPLYPLMIFALINSVISLYYYLRVVKVMVVNEASEEIAVRAGSFRSSLSLNSAIAITLTATIFLGIFATQAEQLSTSATVHLIHNQPLILK